VPRQELPESEDLLLFDAEIVSYASRMWLGSRDPALQATLTTRPVPRRLNATVGTLMEKVSVWSGQAGPPSWPAAPEAASVGCRESDAGGLEHNYMFD
jgi:hypothetical protein